jgi:hypothetical protein
VDAADVAVIGEKAAFKLRIQLIRSHFQRITGNGESVMAIKEPEPG